MAPGGERCGNGAGAGVRDDDQSGAGRKRTRLSGRRGRLRGPARPVAGACAPPESRSGADFHSRARRAISRIHRGGAARAAGARRRLSRDGRLARLSEIAPAAARAAQGRGAVRRRPRQRPGRSVAAPGGDPPRRRRANGAREARTRHVFARRGRGVGNNFVHAFSGQSVRSPFGLRPPTTKGRDLEGHAAPAQRLVAGRSAGGVGTTRRSGVGMDRAGRFPDTVLRRSDHRAHGAGFRLFGLAGDGPRGAFPYTPGSRFFANLGHASGTKRGSGRSAAAS